MPVSQNNKYKNMLITHKKTIDELQEKVRQFDDTEVNKLKAHIMLLRKQNDEHVKNNNDLNNECRSLKSTMDNDSKIKKLKSTIMAESMRCMLITNRILDNTIGSHPQLVNNYLTDEEREAMNSLRTVILDVNHEEIIEEGDRVTELMKNNPNLPIGARINC